MVDKSEWKKVDEEEKKEIETEAKNLMEKFSEKIENIHISKNTEEKGIPSRRTEFEEIPKIEREIMFSNAKEKNKDFIIAETKKW